jgi:hypothetical protein
LKNNNLKKLHEEYNKTNGMLSNSITNNNSNMPNNSNLNFYNQGTKAKEKEDYDLIFNEKESEQKDKRNSQRIISIDMDDEEKQSFK